MDTDPAITKDRYVNRRKMAWYAFCYIVFVGTLVMLYGLSADERAQRVVLMAGFLGTLFGIMVAIITWYFGATTVTDHAEIKKDKN